MKVIKARHTGYRPSGKPLLAHLVDWFCNATPPEHPLVRHHGYCPSALARMAHAWMCCDAFCTTDDCYVLPDCYTAGPGPGLTRHLALYGFDSDDCWSARGTQGMATYNDGDGKWHGSIFGITLVITCIGGVDPSSAGKFSVDWSCGLDSGTVTSQVVCVDPMMISIGPLVMAKGGCCDCKSIGTPPLTDQAGQVTIYIAGNCRKVKFARHVGYTPDGRPIVAKSRDCPWDQASPYHCDNMRCPLNAVVTNVSGCACMAASFGLSYVTDHWENPSVSFCSTTGDAQLLCTDAGYDAQGRSLVTLQLTIDCGASHTGTASITILALDLETLDETFTIVMAGTGGCTGSCTWMWVDMAGVWVYISDTCAGSCTGTPPCSPPAGTGFDGEMRTTPCAGTSECCEGTIHVRITRA